jgi:hypothetical protein
MLQEKAEKAGKLVLKRGKPLVPCGRDLVKTVARFD